MMLRTSFIRLTFCPLALLALLLSTATTEAQDFCNICGQGNFIGFQTGVVSFEYEGVQLTNNCQNWQDIVMNPVAISDDFCRNELLAFTVEVCRCYTADGELVVDLPSVVPLTVAPSPTPTVAPSPAPTVAPTTAPPTMKVPTTAPVTALPTVSQKTLAPTTLEPTMKVPTTAPVTALPTVPQKTLAPTTLAPTTKVPTTAPVTALPTVSQKTLAPTTKVPTTDPATALPTVSQKPLAPTTLAPTVVPTTAPSLSPVVRNTVAAASAPTARCIGGDGKTRGLCGDTSGGTRLTMAVAVSWMSTVLGIVLCYQ